jgi:quercetin dioxygenase-like cupin family protein
MNYRTAILKASALLGLLMLGMQPAVAQIVPQDENGFMIAGPEAMQPAAGARQVAVFGNPSQPGLYVMRITFGPGQGSRPHYHDQARYITVLKGTWWVASGPDGAVYNPDNMQSVAAGSFIYQPPNGHHYDMAKDEEVIVQIMGMGPVVTTSLESSN